jgi:hypothetical protein
MKIATNKLHFSPIFYKKICFVLSFRSLQNTKTQGQVVADVLSPADGRSGRRVSDQRQLYYCG